MIHLPLLAILALAVHTEGSSVLPTDIKGSVQAAVLETYTECGGVLPLSVLHQIRINYKYDQQFSPTEFCVWTFLPQGRFSSIRIALTQNITDEKDGLVAYFWDSAGLTSLKLPQNSTELWLDKAPAFLAFSSDIRTEFKGFLVYINAYGVPGLSTSRAYHLEDDEGEFSYPEKRTGLEEYRNNDRVSIVLQGKTDRAFKMTEIKFRNVDIDSEFDSIAVYTLLGYYDATHFSHLGRISGNNEVEFSTNFLYPTLLLFTSNQNVTGKGFTFEWGSLQHKISKTL